AVPAEVDRILGRGLAKNAVERYPGCRDLAVEFSASRATGKEAADKAAPRTLVASAADVTRPPGTGGEARRGLAGILAGAGPGAIAGWTLFLGALGILALSPYLLNAVTRGGAPAAARETEAPQVAAPTWLRLPPTPAPAPPPAARAAAKATGTLALSLQHKFESGL